MAVVFETQRMRVREFTRADVEPFSRYRAQPEVAAYQSWTTFTLDDGHALFERMQGVPFGTVGHWFQLAVEDRSSGRLLGDLALHFFATSQVEIGFTLDPQHQGQGFAQEAVRGCLAHLFESRDIHRVRSVTDVENAAAVRLLEAVGFRQEAHFVDATWFKGAWGSEYVYAMLAREWST
ncbi:MAG: RimJ/RimL family protein N-acetyltransferase [Myxococcota bacterium]|jgi:RimJ/RimL family protein N-acetyltransferase